MKILCFLNLPILAAMTHQTVLHSDAINTLRNSQQFPVLKNDLILRAAQTNQSIERAPVWIMRQAGRYLPEFRAARLKNDFFTICRTPELACEVTLQPIDRYDGLLDASIIFSDILVVPQAMGLEVQMVPGKGPHFPMPLNVPADLERLVAVDVNSSLGYVFDAITLTRHKLEGRVPLFGFSGAPWTLMAYMIEGGASKTLSKAKTWLFKYPNESHLLLQRITDVVVDYLVGQVSIGGAQLLQVFDSWAGELSPAVFNEFALPYLLQVNARVKQALSLIIKKQEHDPSIVNKIVMPPLSVFARGATHALEALSVSGYDIIQVDWSVDPAVARARVNSAASSSPFIPALQGNADPSLLYADRDAIYAHVEQMLLGFGPQNKYIGNLGHGMYPDHDPEHLKWYLEAIRDISSKLNKNTKQ